MAQSGSDSLPPKNKTPTASQQGSGPSDSQHKIPMTTGPVAVQYVREVKKTRAHCEMDIQVQSRDDSFCPHITGCVFLPGDKLVVVDHTNNKVKLIDLTHSSILSQIKLEGELWGITQVNNTQVAVTCYSAETIFFVHINANQLKLDRNVKVKGQCRGIASIDDKLGVSYCTPAKVEIISIEGKVLNTVISEEQGREISISPSYIAISKDKQNLYMSDFDRNTVTMVDLTGHVLATYNDDKLRQLRGLTVDSEGRVYVCGWFSQNILQLTTDLIEIQELLQQTDGVLYPDSIYHCEATNRLYVGTLCPRVRVYQLK